MKTATTTRPTVTRGQNGLTVAAIVNNYRKAKLYQGYTEAQAIEAFVNEFGEKVLFLLHDNEDEQAPGEVWAFFPSMRWSGGQPGQPLLFASYEHIGQHGGAALSYANSCQPASPEQYADLLNELEARGYFLNVLKPAQRPTCDQCSPLMINGVFCHETGCTNARKVWDATAGEWITPDTDNENE